MKRLISIYAPEIAKEWSPKNADLTPDMVTVGSHKKVWWKGKCGHEWQAVVKNRVSGAGCPYCSGNAVLVGETDLRTLRPEIAAEWSDKNDRMPEDFAINSNQSVLWTCRVCGNEWKARIADRTDGSGCPYCSGKILSGFNDIDALRPDLMAEWSPKNEPGLEHRISDKADRTVWWRCRICGRDYQANIRTRAKGGGNCPFCACDETIRRNEQKRKEIQRKREIERILPRAAVIYYLRHLADDIRENDDSLIGVPLDIYAPELEIAFEIEDVRDTGASLRNEAMVKSSLCRKNHVVLIKLQDEGAESFEDCICVSCNRQDAESLSEALKEVFRMLKMDIDVDILRDLENIVESYKMEGAKEWQV